MIHQKEEKKKRDNQCNTVVADIQSIQEFRFPSQGEFQRNKILYRFPMQFYIAIRSNENIQQKSIKTGWKRHTIIYINNIYIIKHTNVPQLTAENIVS